MKDIKNRFFKSPYPWYRFILRAKWLGNSVKYFFQRGIYGFSEKDADCFRDWFLEVCPEVLKQFSNGEDEEGKAMKKNDYGFEEEMTDIYDIAGKIISRLNEGVRENCNMKNEYEKMFEEIVGKELFTSEELECRNKFWKKEEEIEEYNKENVSKGLDLLKENFNNLRK